MQTAGRPAARHHAAVTIVSAVCGETPNFQATNAGTDQQPVAPQIPSPSISAAISTNRLSIALRCPASSSISANNTSRRSFELKDAVAVDIPPS